MNTVQRRAQIDRRFATSGPALRTPQPCSPCERANVSMNEPQPEEQASLSMMRVDRAVADLEALDVLTADVEDEIHVRVRNGARRVKCAMVSTSPQSTPNAFLISSSP